jgi:hypothetical protein
VCLLLIRSAWLHLKVVLFGNETSGNILDGVAVLGGLILCNLKLEVSTSDINDSYESHLPYQWQPEPPTYGYGGDTQTVRACMTGG